NRLAKRPLLRMSHRTLELDAALAHDIEGAVEALVPHREGMPESMGAAQLVVRRHGHEVAGESQRDELILEHHRLVDRAALDGVSGDEVDAGVGVRAENAAVEILGLLEVVDADRAVAQALDFRHRSLPKRAPVRAPA